MIEALRTSIGSGCAARERIRKIFDLVQSITLLNFFRSG